MLKYIFDTAFFINMSLESEFLELKKKKRAILLAHYYQDSEIQDLADFVGDSLELSRKAAASNAEIILFSGVKFMAEVAKILSPNIKVLVPDLKAGCSLEDSCQPEDFKKFRELHKNHIAITYINCSAEIKALSDIICTSSNAEKIIRSIPKYQPIIFAPDKLLGGYLAKKTGRDMLLWNGSCIVHERFSENQLVHIMQQNPQALVIAHPECPENILKYAHHIGSTSSLLNFTKENQGRTFIVLTESGIIHKMQKISPTSTFLTVPYLERDGVTCINCNNCPFMRLNTLEKLMDVLQNETNEIIVPQTIADKAKAALNKMMELSI